MAGKGSADGVAWQEMTFKKGGPCYRLHPVWTKDMDRQLISMIGNRTYDSIAKHFGKSVDAVRKRAQRLGHTMHQGTFTLRQLARDTGYDRHQLRRAQRALGQKWKRATNRRLLITGEQAIELIDYLAKDRWKGRKR